MMKIFIMPDYDELNLMLLSRLARDYPDECVQEGKNWELIAEIFFRAGFENAQDK